jgi:hypothetical protein
VSEEIRDLVAISAEGHVYAICAWDAPQACKYGFIDEILDGGDSVHRMPRSEAMRRHREYLHQMDVRLRRRTMPRMPAV